MKYLLILLISLSLFAQETRQREIRWEGSADMDSLEYVVYTAFADTNAGPIEVEYIEDHVYPHLGFNVTHIDTFQVAMDSMYVSFGVRARVPDKTESGYTYSDLAVTPMVLTAKPDAPGGLVIIESDTLINTIRLDELNLIINKAKIRIGN